MPGTYSGNRLKKFVKYKSFYKPKKNKKQDKRKKVEKEEEDKIEKEKKKKTEVESKDFEIRVPTLILAEQSKYIKYEEDDKRNIL